MWARWPYSCSIASATDATSTSRNPSTSGSAAGCAALHRLHTKSAEITATTDNNNLVFMVGCGDYSSDTVYYRLGQVARFSIHRASRYRQVQRLRSSGNKIDAACVLNEKQATY